MLSRSIVLLLAPVTVVSAWASLQPSQKLGSFRGGALFARSRRSVSLFAASTAEEVASIQATSDPPSWESLQESLESVKEESPAPLVTLYRDTNGWCPFCERVWVALRYKGIPYQETLVSLQNKPEWYKMLVPTTLVPAVLFHGNVDSGEDGDAVTERKIVWESDAIMKELDAAFPDTPQLVLDTPEYKKALESYDNLVKCGFQFSFGGRNQTVTDAEKEERRKAFDDALDEFDADLGKQEGGNFCLGAGFSAVDAKLIPNMERWRWQLPITKQFDIVKGRPNIQAWFEAIESLTSYNDRVKGDEYSWTATASMFLRFFGGDSPEVASGIERADAAASKLAGGFVEQVSTTDAKQVQRYAIEAAAKLISNHEAVINDCTNPEPKSQQHIGRAGDKDVADAVLRYVASILVQSASDDSKVPMELAQTAPLVNVESDATQDAIKVAHTVASRLCVPRDMGAPAAAQLRAVLTIVAGRLEEQQ